MRLHEIFNSPVLIVFNNKSGPMSRPRQTPARLARLKFAATGAASLAMVVVAFQFKLALVGAQNTATSADGFQGVAISRNKDAEARSARDAAPGVPRLPRSTRTDAHGFLRAEGLTVRELIRDAYGFRERAANDVVGGPAWIDEERYDVVARAEGGLGQSGLAGLSTDAERRLQTLLARHFGVEVVTQSSRRQIFEMMARRDPIMGRGIKVADGTCVGLYGRMPSTKPSTLGPKRPVPRCPFRLTDEMLVAGNITLEDLARLLQLFPSIGTTVVNRTTLKESYDVILRYRLADGKEHRNDANPWPTIVQALDAQLGLRLVSRQALVETLFINEVSRPASR